MKESFHKIDKCKFKTLPYLKNYHLEKTQSRRKIFKKKKITISIGLELITI